MSKKKWEKTTLRLAKDHTWEAPPGYNIFAADRGAVLFNIPATWTITPNEDLSIAFHDKPPPDDDCRLQLSVFHLRPDIDWSGLNVREMLEGALGDTYKGVLSVGEIVAARHHGLELAWRETRYIGENEHREARARTCLAHAGLVNALLTLDFWPEDAERVEPVWDEVMRSMRLGLSIKDPTKGQRFGYG